MTKQITKKHPGGRPTKYIPEIIFPKIEQYLAMTGKENMSLPSIEGLAAHLGITSETVRDWADKNPEFSLTIKKIAEKQKLQLMEDGMYGGKEVNASMAIFLLKANHGLKDGVGQTNVQVNNFMPLLGGETKGEKNG